MSYIVIANAAAGDTEEETVGASTAVLRAHAPTDVARTSGPAELDAVLDRVDGRTVVVAGGDGSIHAVVDRLRSRGELGAARLALVPLGTGNDLARALGIPLDPREAAEVVVAGRPRRLDLVVDDTGGVVVNVAHAGLGAEAAAVAGAMKGRLGSLAYPAGALVAAVRERGWDLVVTVDGDRLSPGPGPDIDGDGDGDGAGRVLMVAVANGSSIGGGTMIAPTAVPDDGLLDVVVCTATGPVARAAFALALRTGRHLERDDVVHRRGTAVHIAGEPVRHNADGELTGDVRERTYTVERSAWALVTP